MKHNRFENNILNLFFNKLLTVITVLYFTVLYCTVLYCIVQYCTVLYCPGPYLCGQELSPWQCIEDPAACQANKGDKETVDVISSDLLKRGAFAIHKSTL